MRPALAMVIACLIITGLDATAESQAATRHYDLNIPLQPLDTALKELAQQAGLQVGRFSDAVQGDTVVGPLIGEYTADQALRTLLTPSGLTYRALNDRAVIILRPEDLTQLLRASERSTLASDNDVAGTGGGSARTGVANSRNGFWNRLRLSRAPNPQTARDQPMAEGRARTNASGSDENQKNEKVQEEILVTGTRIRGVQAQASPTIPLTREDFSETGVATLQEVFERLPQNLDEISPDASFATGTSRLASSNTQSASGISLRGLGAQSTLTLVNGARRPGNVDGRVVDVSAIPLSAVERIEIVTGGQSAIYGSDAVAGVVNIITRRNFEGLESQIYFGAAEDGGERFQVSQVVGKKSARVGFVAAADYTRSWLLDAVEAGATLSTPSVSGVTVRQLPLQPESDRISLMLSGHYDLLDDVELSGDVLYSDTGIDSVTDLAIAPGPFSPGSTQFQASDQHTKQYSANLGARFEIGRSWQLNLSGLYGESDNSGDGRTILNEDMANESRSFGSSDTEASIRSLGAVIDGPLFEIGGGRTIRAALGGEARKETLSRALSFLGVPAPTNKIDRTIEALFAELVVPLSDEGSALGRLEISIAGRYDDYDDFGNTFNPQLGAVWTPLRDLTLRGAYSEAFRAPDLFTLSFGNQNFLIGLPDPAAPLGFSPALLSFGGNPDLGPETAKTWSGGFDAKPAWAPWLRLSGSYFEVDYKNRIDQPADDAIIFFVLQNEALFGPLIDRSPTPAQVAAILGDGSGFVSFVGPIPISVVPTLPGLVTFDNRFNNIGIEEVRGVDADIEVTIEASGGTRLSFGLNATHFLDYERRLATGGLPESRLNRPGTPPDTRIRGKAGWQRGPFGAFVQLNYVDRYKDIFARPEPVKIDSWTTADLTLRYGRARSVKPGFSGDLTLALSIENAFDEAPPFFGSNRVGLNFDSAIANASGRVVSFRLSKKW